MEFRSIWRKFRRDPLAVAGLAGIVLLLFPAICAPLLANGRPLLLRDPEGYWTAPFWRYLFAPDSTEFMIEQCFNYVLLAVPAVLLFRLWPRRRWRYRRIAIAAVLVLLAVPFFLVHAPVDKRNYRELAQQTGYIAIFAPIPYSPVEAGVARPYEPPSSQIGRASCRERV